MDARGDEFRHLVRLDAGERIIDTLVTYLCGPGSTIRSGLISGIGAASHCEIGYYDLQTGEYQTRIIEESCEITALIGNITRIDGQPVIHAHITLAGPDYTVLGGHLVEGTISVTGEIWIHGTPLEVTRRPGDFPGLKLIRFPD
jgi:predicted DNA-binding protein with PD1-like motif